MKDCVRFCKQMICVAECVLLSAILADDTLLDAVLAGITVLVMLPSIVYIVYNAVKNKDLKILLDDESRYFNAGFFLICSVLLVNVHQYVPATILGVFSAWNFISMCSLFLKRK